MRDAGRRMPDVKVEDAWSIVAGRALDEDDDNDDNEDMGHY